MSAQVDVKPSGEEDVFVVNPGPVFHFKDVKIIGLSENLVRQVMKDAPKAGDVYSAARVSDWLEQAEKQIEMAGAAQKFAGEEVRLDHAATSANVTVLFK
jgi:hypothetical protein